MQALEPDVLEATDHAKTMSPEEVEEIIDYILNEVFSFSLVTVDLLPISRFGYSMGKTLSAATIHLVGSSIDPYFVPLDLSPSCYRSSQTLPFR